MAHCLFALQAPPKMSMGPMKETKQTYELSIKTKTSQETTLNIKPMNLKHPNKKVSQASNRFKAVPFPFKIDVRDPCIRRLKTKFNRFCLIRSFAEKFLGLDCWQINQRKQLWIPWIPKKHLLWKTENFCLNQSDLCWFWNPTSTSVHEDWFGRLWLHTRQKHLRGTWDEEFPSRHVACNVGPHAQSDCGINGGVLGLELFLWKLWRGLTCPPRLCNRFHFLGQVPFCICWPWVRSACFIWRCKDWVKVLETDSPIRILDERN